MAVVPTQRDAMLARAIEKRFQKPITLVFEDVPTGEAITCRIVTLDQLKEVCQKLDKGEIKEAGRFSSLEMQLFGHMAESTGFLREVRSAHPLAEGLGLLAGRGELRSDLESVLGEEGTEDVIEFAKKVATRPQRSVGLDVAPSTGKSAWKADGVNLTPEAEKKIQEMHGLDDVKVQAGNAIRLMLDSIPGLTSEEMDEILEEAKHRDPETREGSADLAARMEAATRGGPLADLKSMLTNGIEEMRPVIRERLPELAEDFTAEDLEKALKERGLLASEVAEDDEVNINRARADKQIAELQAQGDAMRVDPSKERTEEEKAADAEATRLANIGEKLMADSKPGLTTEEIEGVIMSKQFGLPADEKVMDRLDVKEVEDRVIETGLPYDIPEDQDGAPNTIVCRTCGMKLEAAEGQLLSQAEINDFVAKHHHEDE